MRHLNVMIFLCFTFLLSNVAIAKSKSQCEKSAEKYLSTDSKWAITRYPPPYDRGVFLGFAEAPYTEGHVLYVSMVLETKKEVYFYSEPCDMCADLYVCEKKTGEMKEFKTDKSLGCSDLPLVDPATIIYTDCP